METQRTTVGTNEKPLGCYRNQEPRSVKTFKRGVIYARYSSDQQDDTSIGVQIEECQKYAQKQNIAIVREPYTDAAQSGTATQHRAAYQKLMVDAFAKTKDFEYVIVFHSSRWGRSMDSEVDEFLLEKHGVKVISATQPITTEDSPESFLVRGIIRKIDAYYSIQLARYTHVYQSNNARKGFINGGRPLDGYTVRRIPTGKLDKQGRERCKVQYELDEKPGQFDLNGEPRWKMIAFFFDAFAEGKGMTTIAKEAYTLGWRAKTVNEPLCMSHVRAALLNPTYTGYVVWNRKKWHRVEGRRRHVKNSPDKWVFSDEPAHPAIIAREKFEYAIERFNKNPRGRYAGKQLLSGLVVCANCGSAYTLSSNRKKNNINYEYYICNKKHRSGWERCNGPMIQKGKMEAAVQNVFLKRILTEDEVKQFTELFNDWTEREKAGHSPEVKQLDGQIAQLDKELANLKAAVATGEVPLKHLAGEIEQRDALKGKLQEQKAHMGLPVKQETLHYEPEKLEKWLTSLRNLYQGMDLESRREMLRHYIKKIEIHSKKKGRIVYDPASILRLQTPHRKFPTDDLVCPENGCGGWI